MNAAMLAEAAQLLLKAAEAYGVPALRRELTALRLALEAYEQERASPIPRTGDTMNEADKLAEATRQLLNARAKVHGASVAPLLYADLNAALRAYDAEREVREAEMVALEMLVSWSKGNTSDHVLAMTVDKLLAARAQAGQKGTT